MTLVYIADGEPNIRKLVAFGLEDAGYESVEFTDRTSLLVAARQERPGAVILDWMIPPSDGLAVCHTLRKSPEGKHLSILMLTAREEEFDHVLGLEIGTDDYVVKPLSMKELVIRMRAVLRHSERAAQDVEEEVLTDGGLTVDIARRMTVKNGELHELTAKEFDLLVMLMEHQGRMMMRGALLDKAQGMEYYGDTRTVDVHVYYLRQKIEEDSEPPRLVQTVRGIGYKFTKQE